MSINPPMRKLMMGVFFVSTVLNALAGNVKIIANPSVQTNSISADELRGVFLLQRKTLSDGSRVLPVLQKDGTAHETFVKEYMHREGEELHTYYQGLVFTGKSLMPKEVASDEEVVSYVARTRGAIGYVSSATSTEGIKVLVVPQMGRSGERALLRRVEPIYPETLKMRGIGGVVRLELSISPKGSVDAVTVLGGNPILTEAAVTAVKQWVYAVWPSQTTVQVSIPFEPRP